MSKTISKSERRPLSQWNVILHNDDSNALDYVVSVILDHLRMSQNEATQKAKDAHDNGKSLLLTTHLERAELIIDQFKKKDIQVTAERI